MPDTPTSTHADTLDDLRDLSARWDGFEAEIRAAEKTRQRTRTLKELVWFVTMITCVVAVAFGFVTGLVLGCFQGASGHDARAFGIIGLTTVTTGVVGFAMMRGLDRLSTWSLR